MRRWLFWRQKESVSGELPLRETIFTVLDTELTGTDPRHDELLSVGAIRMRGFQIVLGEIFYREVFTPRVCRDTVAIHQILPSEVQRCPEIGQILPELADFIQNTVLVGFYPHLDLTFIRKYFKRFNLNFPEVPVVDVYRVHQWLKKKVYRPTPSTIRYRFGKVWKSWPRTMEWPCGLYITPSTTPTLPLRSSNNSFTFYNVTESPSWQILYTSPRKGVIGLRSFKSQNSKGGVPWV